MNDFPLARVRERSIGSLFFSIFGGLSLFVSLLAFGVPTRWIVLLLVAAMLAFIAVAVWFMRAVPKEVQPEPQRERDGTMFGIVNAIQGVAIFFDLLLANRFHHPNIAFPLAVLIVGLHIFALPRSYWMTSNLITGGLLIAAALSCMLFSRDDVMVGAVTMCAGFTLWFSAVWKLMTASRFLRASSLTSV